MVVGAVLEPWTIVITVHAVAAGLAITLGTVNAFRRTRGDLTHRIVGRTWSALMLVVSIGSFWIGGYISGLSLFLHGLAAWTVISICAGVLAARHGAIGVHRRFMLGAYLGLLGAFIGVISVPSRRVPSWFAAHPLTMSALAIVIIAIGLATARAIRRTARSRKEQPPGAVR